MGEFDLILEGLNSIIQYGTLKKYRLRIIDGN